MSRAGARGRFRHTPSTERRHGAGRYGRLAAAAWIAVLWAVFTVGVEAEDDLRHPLEVEALTRPQAVIDKLPAARAALGKDDHTGIAMLALAEANACRVMADWVCQRTAGSTAVAAADRTDSVYLQVRARIAFGRALSRLGDFSKASQMLTEARQRLVTVKNDALMADNLLAYSSISARLGKLDESYRYASDGLAYASADAHPEMRTRLLRNMAKATSDTGKPREAQTRLHEAATLLSDRQPPISTSVCATSKARPHSRRRKPLPRTIGCRPQSAKTNSAIRCWPAC